MRCCRGMNRCCTVDLITSVSFFDNTARDTPPTPSETKQASRSPHENSYRDLCSRARASEMQPIRSLCLCETIFTSPIHQINHAWLDRNHTCPPTASLPFPHRTPANDSCGQHLVWPHGIAIHSLQIPIRQIHHKQRLANPR